MAGEGKSNGEQLTSTLRRCIENRSGAQSATARNTCCTFDAIVAVVKRTCFYIGFLSFLNIATPTKAQGPD